MELGCWSVTAHHRVEKKTPQSSDSSALHVTSVSIEESRHKRCLSTKNALHKKKPWLWEGEGAQGASGAISERNERFSFKLPRRLKLKTPCLAVQLPTKD